MNVLVPFLRDHPQAVDRLAHDEQASIEQLIRAIEPFESPFLLNDDIVGALARGQPNGQLLREAYLPVIEHELWQAQLESAEPAELPDPHPFAIGEHATFVRGAYSDRGVSLPENDHVESLQVSLYAGGNDAIQRVSIEYAHGPGPPTSVSVSLARGCSLPDWGRCNPRDCCGDCRLRRVYNDEDGLVCKCPHLT